ncbi:MAG: hypothetical protein DWQ35_15970 [Planctomycetota bacterium]|nr:MAG: hypothetical protein DWQ35_15970 [Planctomycetota bacterium]REK18271.1 MAG: hypothetical protein DWQ42_20545 [Planctomycetota bacterium]REK49141.1 MAG: hypothetical protein DWQ46_01145 [Planctomycetota bacterium]
MPAAVTDAIAFVLLELVMPLCHEQQEPVAITDVLHVREAPTLAVCTLPFCQVNLILRYELPIDLFWILVFWNPAGNVPPVSVTQVAHCDLLDQPFRR